MSLSINLADYGFGQNNLDQVWSGAGSVEDVNNLNKALSAEHITGRDTTNMEDASGSPLKVESLDKTLKNITFRRTDIALWNQIPKKPCYNTVEEFNQQSSYGQDRGGFYAEGQLPNEEDSIFTRRATYVKYLGVTKAVTHQMTLVNTMIGNVIQKAIEDGTMWILRKLNRSLYFSDENIIPLEFSGFIAQQMHSGTWPTISDYYASDNVVDLHGSQLTENAIESGANTIVEAYGLGTQLYAPPKVLSEFVKNFYGNKFIMPNTAALTDGVMGQHVKSFESQFGNIGLNKDVFFNKLPAKDATTPADSPLVPPTPVWDTTNPVTPVVAPVAGSNWKAADVANPVYYAVSALNNYGESMLAITAAPATVVENGAVDLMFTAGVGTVVATGYRIYRTIDASPTPTSKFYPLFEVSVLDLTNGYDQSVAGTIRDKNHILPNTDRAILFQFDTDTIEFGQLAPLMKMDLAVLSPSFRFMVLLYGTTFLYAPKRIVQFTNIGTIKV